MVKFRNVEEDLQAKDGEYLVKIEECEERISKNSGEPYLNIKFKGIEKLITIFDIFLFHSGMANRTKKLLQVCSLLKEDATFEEMKQLEINSMDLLGKVLYITIKEDKNTGYMKPTFAGFRKYDGDLIPSSSEDEIIDVDEECPL